MTAAAWMGIAEAEQTAAQTAAEQRTASGPRCLKRFANDTIRFLKSTSLVDASKIASIPHMTG